MAFVVPAGFVLESIGATRVLVDASRRERLAADGLGRMSLVMAAARPREGGRGGSFDVTLGGEDLVLRIGRRGGLVRFLLRDRSFDSERAFREVAALAAACERGVPAVTPVAAVSMPAGLGLFRHWVLTVAEPGAQDLLDALADPGRSVRERQAIVRAAGHTVRLAFEHGIEHADLHPRNLLVGAGPIPECKLVDLDQARVAAGSLPPAVRIAALARFVRFLERHGRDGGSAMTRSDLLRFFKAAEGDDRRRIAVAAFARVRRMRWLHPPRRRSDSPGALPPPEARIATSEVPLDPEITFALTPRSAREARACVERTLSVAAKTGVASCELLAVPRSAAAAAELRSLSLRIAALRFVRVTQEAEGDAWRAALRVARGRRIVLVRHDVLDARFLTEALERLDGGADLVVGERSRAASGGLRALFEAIASGVLRRRFGVPVRDLFASFAARHDERFRAAVRGLRAKRFLLPELAARLAEAGAVIAPVSFEAKASFEATTGSRLRPPA